MSDKRKKREFFDDIFEVDDFENVEEIMDYIMERLGMDLSDLSKKAFISAFSVSNRSGDKSGIRELGNVSDDNETDGFERQQMRVDDPSPLIDVFEIEGHIHAMAELPGVEKDDIELYVTESTLEIKFLNSEEESSELIDFSATVNPDSARATYINGVLEVIMDKIEFGKARLIKID
ncbi:Hsp20/alpha crystallin family protein [Methanolobus sp. ZRKC3]|uniref:Hsp20/alpha crystallin family protein n=1 Tax=Methanolobus sp. ZRKC3 TaxID=3125786 RepID=UPI00324993DD